MDGKKIDNKVKRLYEYKGEFLSAKEVMEKLGCSHFPVYSDPKFLEKHGIRLAKVSVIEIYRNGKLWDRGTSARALSVKHHYGKSYFAQAEERGEGYGGYTIKHVWYDAEDWYL